MTIIPLLHATCVEKNGIGILLRGHAGAGKSSFALSLINHGFKLVGDDQVHTWESEGLLIAQAPDALKGLLEVRGMGILKFDYSPTCHVRYLIDLVPGFKPDRYPTAHQVHIHKVPLHSFQMDPLDPQSCEKALALFHQDFLGFYETPQKGMMASKA